MITKFKLFESVNDGTPGVGDYVIVNETEEENFYSDDALNFINNSIGIIFKKAGAHSFLIKYFDIPKNIIVYFQYSDYSDGLKVGNGILTSIKKIKYWSKDKEELIPLIQATKYNL